MSDETPVTQPGPIEFLPLDTAAPNQTTKQPVIWRCPTVGCIENEPLDTGDPRQINKPGTRFFEFESDYPECPKCGCKPPFISKRALIHLLLRATNGPIVGEHGLTWAMACDPPRTHLATEDNGEAATGDSRAANCPGCLDKIKGQVVVNGQALNLK